MTFTCLNSLAQWRNSLKPAGSPAGELIIAKDGQPRCGILCPEDPTPQDKKAAQELQHWFKEITGATINIYYWRRSLKEHHPAHRSCAWR